MAGSSVPTVTTVLSAWPVRPGIGLALVYGLLVYLGAVFRAGTPGYAADTVVMGSGRHGGRSARGRGRRSGRYYAERLFWVHMVQHLLMITVAVRWSRAAPEHQGLGTWLESARRSALFGPDQAVTDAEVGRDEEALTAYNAMLTALHERSTGSGLAPDGTGKQRP